MSGTKQRIGVLVDGSSAQRLASLRAGEAITAALTEAGHDARAVFVDRDLDVALRQDRIEVAFLALRGRYGSDGCVQGLLELMGIPYTGSGVLASALAMNQAKTKEVLRLHNLPTAPAYVLRADAERTVLENHGSFGFPVTVAPLGTGLCVRPRLAEDELELEAAVEEAFRQSDEVLVERFVEGRVVTVAVLDGTAVGVYEVGPAGARTETLARPRLTVARQRSLLRMAQLSCETLGVEGAALVEIVVSDRLNELVRGVDVAPLLTPDGAFARIAAGAGLSYPDLIEEILQGARLRAHGRRRERRTLQLGPAPYDGPERRTALSPVAH